MIPSYFKIEILAIQDEFVLSGSKGLNRVTDMEACPAVVVGPLGEQGALGARGGDQEDLEVSPPVRCQGHHGLNVLQVHHSGALRHHQLQRNVRLLGDNSAGKYRKIIRVCHFSLVSKKKTI